MADANFQERLGVAPGGAAVTITDDATLAAMADRRFERAQEASRRERRSLYASVFSGGGYHPTFSDDDVLVGAAR